MILTQESWRRVYGSGVPGGHHVTPEVCLAGWSDFTRGDAEHLAPHFHAGAYEFHLLLRGDVDWVVGGRARRVRAGEVFMTRPGEAHAGAGGGVQPCELIWVLLSAEACAAAPDDGLPTLLTRLGERDGHVFRPGPNGVAAFQQILGEHESPDDHSRTVIRGALAMLLADLLRAGTGQARKDECGKLIRAALDLMEDAAAPDKTLGGICARLGVSHTTLNRQFVSELGAPMKTYLIRERARQAAARLRDQWATVTEIAAELGFASSQHLATAFRQMFGVSPSEFRARAQALEEARPIPWTEAVELRQRRAWSQRRAASAHTDDANGRPAKDRPPAPLGLGQ